MTYSRLFSFLMGWMLTVSLFAQSNSISQITVGNYPSLDAQFTAYQITVIDANELLEELESQPLLNIRLNDDLHWVADMQVRDISSRSRIRLSTPQGIQETQPSQVLTLYGYPEQGGSLSLTVAQDFFYAFYAAPDGSKWFVEPVRHFDPSASVDAYVLYQAAHVIPKQGKLCASDLLEKHSHAPSQDAHSPDLPESSMVGQCKELELAIASDFSMFQKKGGVAGVEAFTAGVINNVQTNYDDEFDDEISFVIVEQFVSTCSSCDPWTSSTDPFILLPDFRGWANGGGFAAVHDLGELWTNRNFDGSTIGLAYVTVVCGFSRYHILQDFTNNAAYLRVLTSHEIGHNFSCTHDASGSPYIMAPAVSAATEWSTMSENQVNSYLPSLNCLSLCPPAVPTADFKTLYPVHCPGAQVEFINQSSGYVSLNWSFPGGMPSSSTDEHPIITYNNPGNYPVTLIVTNNSGTTSTTTKNITVDEINGQETILLEDFESDLSAWTLTNPDGGITWEIINVDGTEIGSQAAYVNHFNYNALGRIDGLESQVMDFSNRTNLWVSFDHAYAHNGSFNSEKFRVKVSVDGGVTFPFTILDVSENGSYNMATRPNMSLEFFPAEHNDWCFGQDIGAQCFDLDLNAFAGETQVALRFEMENHFGNNFFLDNIRVRGSCQVLPPPIAEFTASDTVICPDQSVQFTDLSSGGEVEAWNWSFEGGIPPYSTEQNPLVFYANPGTYDVALNVSNASGTDTKEYSQMIHVLDDPVADFSYSINGLSVAFTNSSTNADTYEWNFGDGNSSNEENPTHIYEMPGTYTVTLYAENECDIDSRLLTFTLIIPPVAGFTVDTTMGCVPLTVQFSDTSLYSPDSLMWIFEGGNPDTVFNASSPWVTYHHSGQYAVSLYAYNTAGADTLIDSTYIEVWDTVLADFSSEIEYDSVLFVSQSTGHDSLRWYFGDDSTAVADSVIHRYEESGDYAVMLVAYGRCANDTSTQIVTIRIGPKADFIADITAGCDSLSVLFEHTSTGDSLSWQWFFPGGNPSMAADSSPIRVLYDSIGLYDVMLIVNNAEGSDTLIRTNYIAVSPDTIADFTYSIDSLTVAFTSQSPYADSIYWDFGDGFADSTFHPTHTYAKDSVYTVRMIAWGPCGPDTLYREIAVGSIPDALFSMSSFGICAGNFIVDFENLSSGNITFIEWTFEGGDPSSILGDTSPTVSYHFSGSFDVQLVVGNGLGYDTLILEDTVHVGGPPVADFTYIQVSGLTFQFSNTSMDADSVFWDFGDGANSTVENPSHTYSSQGNYTVTLIAFNVCDVDTISYTLGAYLNPVANFTSDVMNGCAPLVVQFSDLSTNNPLTWNWIFEGGNPATSTDTNPVVTYPDTGSFDVQLIVTNNVGADTLRWQDYIAVDSYAVAGFTYVTQGLEVRFTDASRHADGVRYEFGDGQQINQANPTHFYDTSGTYEVLQIVSNACGSDTIVSSIVIVVSPEAAFEADVTQGCVPLTVQYQDLSTYEPTSWEWSFEGGTPATSTSPNPQVVYANAGTYDVNLIVSNAAGADTLLYENFISIDDLPTAGFSYLTNALTADFFNEALLADSVFWDFGDGTGSSDWQPMHTYGAQGDYSITQIVWNQCGTDTLVQVIRLVLTPDAQFTAASQQLCAPQTVQFTDQSTNMPTSWQWSFEGGSPATSTDQHPLVSYQNTGLFDVQLIVTNAVGTDTFTREEYIQVSRQPIASFSGAVNNLSISFSNTSQLASAYSWNYGDGVTSTDFEDIHNYLIDSIYTVTLVVSNYCGTDTASQTYEVGSIPTAHFIYEGETGCLPHTVQFVNQASSSTRSVRWQFPGGSPTTSQADTVQVTYNNAGSYPVSMIASNALGHDTMLLQNLVSIEQSPTADFDFNRNGLEIQFENLSQDANGYQWYFGDGGSSIAVHPMHTYANEGIFTVMLIVENNCGVDTFMQSLNLINKPQAAILPATPSPICINDTIVYTDVSSGLVSQRLWSFEGGNPLTSMLETQSVIYTTAGTFDVDLRVGNIAGESHLHLQDHVLVRNNPIAAFSYVQSGFDIDFTNSSQFADSYLWDFGNGQSSTQPNPQYSYTDAGTYIVRLLAINECDTASIIQSVVIVEPPIAIFDSDQDGGCPPLTVHYESLQDADNLSHEWFFEGGSPGYSTEADPIVIYPNYGVFDVTYRVANSAGTDTLIMSDYITVQPLPTAQFFFSMITGDSVQFVNTSPFGETFFWSFGDGNADTSASPTHVYEEADLYNVVLIASNDCGSDTLERGITIIISDAYLPDGVESLTVFPNPNRGTFYLEMQSSEPIMPQFRMLNILGQELYRQIPQHRSKQIEATFEVSHLPSGTYLLEIQYGAERIFRRLVITK